MHSLTHLCLLLCLLLGFLLLVLAASPSGNVIIPTSPNRAAAVILA